jgi:nucleotide-binding universal stress UspA family protein
MVRSNGRALMYKTVVIGADSSPTASRAMDRAIGVARSMGSELHIVTAYKKRPSQAAVDRPEELATSVSSVAIADSLLEDLASRARFAGLTPVTHTRKGDPVDAILDVAREVGADLIVVGSKGMTGVGRITGSVPDAVSHKADCCTLIVRTT